VQHRLLFLSMLVIGFSLTSYSIAPPRKGVKTPEKLYPFFQQIRSSYSDGYWAKTMKQRRERRQLAATEGLQLSVQLTTADSMTIPILLAQYSDFSTHYDSASFQQLLFDGPNSTGTMSQYYDDVSYHQLMMNGYVHGWFKLPRASTYYIDDNYGLDYGGRDLVIDAIVQSDSIVDYSKFIDKSSLDGEGYHVLQLGVVHPGGDAAAGAANIWSHRWNIRSRLLTRKNLTTETILTKANVLSSGHYQTNDYYNGQHVIIDGDYALEPELSGSSNSSGGLIEIGVFCHEFGHVFGLPDLYDTDGSSEGIGQWCLMASGSYGGDGNTSESPTHMSAWCKEQLGWVTPMVVTSYTKQQPIASSTLTPTIYKLLKLGQSSTQYFLIENRTKHGFDTSLINGGLLIFHIDNSQSTNTNEDHYRVDLEQADGLRNLNNNVNRADAGDPYPGSTVNRNFNSTTTPNSKDYNGNLTYVGVNNISNQGDTMHADLDIGNRPYLKLLSLSINDSGQVFPNNRLEPGETGVVTVGIQNIYTVGDSSATISVVGNASGALIDSTSTTFRIAGLAQTVLTTQTKISLQSSFVPREVTLTVRLHASNFDDTVATSIVFGYPKILLMDGDSIAQSVTQYYRNALDSAGKYYEVVRTRDSIPSGTELSKRSTLFYFSGRQISQTIASSILDSIIAVVQRGGNVVISGQNIAEDLQGRGVSALSDVFHVGWSKNITLNRTVYGVTTDVLGANIGKVMISGGDGASNQTSPDALTIPNGNAIPFLYYTSSTSGTIAGAYFHNTATHAKIVFLGFGLEALNSASSAISRSAFIQSLTDWFDGITTAVVDRSIIAPKSYQLGLPYPNPFNPTTMLEYSVPVASKVMISIYNVLGQKVQDLGVQEVSAGSHKLSIDGARFSSGIYFFRFEAGTFFAVRKLIMVK
jgi:M6 family metalloprotease-like protein